MSTYFSDYVEAVNQGVAQRGVVQLKIKTPVQHSGPRRRIYKVKHGLARFVMSSSDLTIVEIELLKPILVLHQEKTIVFPCDARVTLKLSQVADHPFQNWVGMLNDDIQCSLNLDCH